jgi:hypothetical protein
MYGMDVYVPQWDTAASECKRVECTKSMIAPRSDAWTVLRLCSISQRRAWIVLFSAVGLHRSVQVISNRDSLLYRAQECGGPRTAT